MQIIVKGQELECMDVCEGQSVLALKETLAEQQGVAVEDQMLVCQGKPLSDEQSLADCGIENMMTVYLESRLRGGKVHGSLARAGKVKGQTPKVESEEKKKKKTGRAKRRLQYNRRFVSVVATFGKKKGPNSNAT